jgi:hypothetical protein
MCNGRNDFLIGGSVTEYEFKYAMRDLSRDAGRCVWLRSEFDIFVILYIVSSLIATFIYISYVSIYTYTVQLIKN